MSRAHSHPFGLEMAAQSLRSSAGKEGCGLKTARNSKIAFVEAEQTENSNIPEASEQEMRQPRSWAFCTSLVAALGEGTKIPWPKVCVGDWHPWKRNNEGKEGVRERERGEWCPVCGVRKLFYKSRTYQTWVRERKENIMNLKRPPLVEALGANPSDNSLSQDKSSGSGTSFSWQILQQEQEEPQPERGLTAARRQ